MIKTLLAFLVSIAFGFHLNLFEEAKQKVVYVTDASGTSGGTGFYVKAPESGRTYILTNRHICDHMAQNGYVFVRTESAKRGVPRRVLEESATTDACLVEPLDPTITGYDLDTRALVPNAPVTVIGHPLLQPLTETRGGFVGPHDVAVGLFIVQTEDEQTQCTLLGGRLQDQMMFIFNIQVCVRTYDAIGTTVEIFGGNSGSPMFNRQGHVVGLVFASSSQTNWAEAIPASDLLEFLKPW